MVSSIERTSGLAHARPEVTGKGGQADFLINNIEFRSAV
jgi:hypothetical protein